MSESSYTKGTRPYNSEPDNLHGEVQIILTDIHGCKMNVHTSFRSTAAVVLHCFYALVPLNDFLVPRTASFCITTTGEAEVEQQEQNCSCFTVRLIHRNQGLKNKKEQELEPSAAVALNGCRRS